MLNTNLESLQKISGNKDFNPIKYFGYRDILDYYVDCFIDYIFNDMNFYLSLQDSIKERNVSKFQNSINMVGDEYFNSLSKIVFGNYVWGIADFEGDPLTTEIIQVEVLNKPLDNSLVSFFYDPILKDISILSTPKELINNLKAYMNPDMVYNQNAPNSAPFFNPIKAQYLITKDNFINRSLSKSKELILLNTKNYNNKVKSSKNYVRSLDITKHISALPRYSSLLSFLENSKWILPEKLVQGDIPDDGDEEYKIYKDYIGKSCITRSTKNSVVYPGFIDKGLYTYTNDAVIKKPKRKKPQNISPGVVSQ